MYFNNKSLDNYQLPQGKALILSFVDSELGPVLPMELGTTITVKDCSEDPKLKSGIAGFLWGSGNYNALDVTIGSTWMVFETNLSETIKTKSCVKAKSGKLVCIGEKTMCSNFVFKHSPPDLSLTGVFAQTQKEDGEIFTGNDGVSWSAGNCAAVAGDWGTARVDGDGAAKTGRGGVSLSHADSSSGPGGISVVRSIGRAKAGIGGVIVISSINVDNGCSVMKCIEVDGVKVKPDTYYTLDSESNFIEAEEGCVYFVPMCRNPT